jgi:PPOX class probable F420-dependent enzyme
MDIDTLGAAKYLSLTTFRKDGTPVATPVWLVRDGDALCVITSPSSGKAKRLRSNTSVELAPCDMRGRTTGESVAGTAVLLDAPDTVRTQGLITKRYGLMGRLLTWQNERKARKSGQTGHVGIRITLAG